MTIITVIRDGYVRNLPIEYVYDYDKIACELCGKLVNWCTRRSDHEDWLDHMQSAHGLVYDPTGEKPTMRPALRLIISKEQP